MTKLSKMAELNNNYNTQKISEDSPLKIPEELSGLELDHIGIAVESIEARKGFYELLGLQRFHVEEVESERVKVCMLFLDNQCQIELLEPTSEESPIAKFLEKRGEGIHHICLRVQNIEFKIKELVEKGITMINEQPKVGAHHCRVAFVHPKSTGGVLVELSEKIKKT